MIRVVIREAALAIHAMTSLLIWVDLELEINYEALDVTKLFIPTL